MWRRIRLIACLLLCLPLLLAAATDKTDGQQSTAILVDVQGAIGPATKDYIHRSLQAAQDRNASLFIIRMDTPGGLDASMRDIIKEILASSVPVVTYVHPSGARAASAGTYILYASHVAAMTPATNLGSATPVSIGGGDNTLPGKQPVEPPALPGMPEGKQDQPADGESPAANGADKESASDEADTAKPGDDAMRHKIINDAVSYIRGLARLHGRNADWAERAVREAANLPAEEALAMNVIDIVANDLDDLLQQIHGRKVKVQGKEITLDTLIITVETIEPDWRNELLSIITNPNIAYVLMLIGIYGLIYEFSNPGAIFPGVVGAISLLLALYAFQVLPINHTGLALILLGVGLMVAEAFAPSFGMLGIGGVVAFVFGSIILMETDNPLFQISITLIISFTVISAAMVLLLVGLLVKLRSRKIVSGVEEIPGMTGEVLADFDGTGQVRVHSEIWQARCDSALKKGQKITVDGIDGLTLKVSPITTEKEK
jgi:membrane-bound serine protease (ClpP class)